MTDTIESTIDQLFYDKTGIELSKEIHFVLRTIYSQAKEETIKKARKAFRLRMKHNGKDPEGIYWVNEYEVDMVLDELLSTLASEERKI